MSMCKKSCTILPNKCCEARRQNVQSRPYWGTHAHTAVRYLPYMCDLNPKDVGSEVLTAVVMKSSILWDLMPCSPLLATCFTLLSCLAYALTRRWRWHIPPKYHLTLNGLHSIISQKTDSESLRVGEGFKQITTWSFTIWVGYKICDSVLDIITCYITMAADCDAALWWDRGFLTEFLLQIQRSRVRFLALPDFLRSRRSGTGSTQPREDNRGATWKKK
jgi:hypothetical protein